MNKYQVMLSVMLSFAIVLLAEASDQPKMYQEKSGYVRSVITQSFSKDNPSTLTETLFWDNWGMKIAKYQIVDKTGRGTKTVIRLTADNTQENLIAVDEVALVQLPSGEFKSIDYRAVDIMNTFSREEKQDMATTFIRSSGQWVETDQKKVVAGQTCTVWHLKANDAHTNCIWRGIILETIMGAPGSSFLSEKKTSEIKVQAIDSAYFEIPGRIEP